MKKNSFRVLLLIISLLMIMSFSSCKSVSKSMKMPELDIPRAGNAMPVIEYSFELPDAEEYPTNADVFRFLGQSETPIEEVKKILSIFGMSSETSNIREFDDYILADDGINLVDYEISTQMWSYINRGYVPSVFQNLPSDDEASDIAMQFLMQKGLFEERFENAVVVTQYEGNEMDDSYSPYCKSVYFYPQINKSPVLGVSRIVVKVGTDGRIVGVMKYYKDYVWGGTIELASPKSYEEGIKKNAFSSSIAEDAVSARIISVKLGYWEDAGSRWDQPFLQPVWIFCGESTLRDGSKESFDIIVQAAKEVYSSDSEPLNDYYEVDEFVTTTPNP